MYLEGNMAATQFCIFIHLWAIYIFPGSVHLFCCSQIGRPIFEIYKSHRYMSLEIGTEAAQFPFWKYLFPISGTESLQWLSRICLPSELLKQWKEPTLTVTLQHCEPMGISPVTTLCTGGNQSLGVLKYVPVPLQYCVPVRIRLWVY